MTGVYSVALMFTLLLGLFCRSAAGEVTEEKLPGSRERRSMPNWALTSSDFFAWVESLRAHAGYDKIEELARTFWAHFPPASYLGYDTPDNDK